MKAGQAELKDNGAGMVTKLEAGWAKQDQRAAEIRTTGASQAEMAVSLVDVKTTKQRMAPVKPR